jgi:exo-beta-1,3-glucanase (GH17 family)
MKTKAISTVLIVLMVLPCYGIVTYDVNDLLEPDFYVHGLCFSPFMDGQGPGDVIPLEQIQERLAIITRKPHTKWIRTYGATNGLEKIPAEANSLDISVAMGSWVRHGSDPNEITNLIQACQNGLVKIAVIGNEEIYANDNGHSTSLTPIEYFDLLDNVRQQLDDANCRHVPIAAAEPFETLFEMDSTGISYMKHTELLDHIDILFLNIYPFWTAFPDIENGGAHISTAKDILALKYKLAVDEIKSRKPAMLIVIGETGWASNGPAYGDAEPSLDNLAQYFHEVSEWSTDTNVPLFFFEAFDEKWKAASPTDIEANFGIWNSDGTLKWSFLKNPVFWENFDLNTPPSYYTRQHWNAAAPEPNICEGDSGSDGSFLRLLYDATGQTHYSSAAFERVVAGLFEKTMVQFDFRMSGLDTEDDADGFGILLLPTLLNGKTGCSNYSDNNFFAEMPKAKNAIGIGLDIYHPSGPNDKIHISWDEQNLTGEGINSLVDLDSGVFHRIQIHLRPYQNTKAMLDIFLHPDIYNWPNAEPVIIAENLLIDVSGHPYAPYESRLEFVGRCGGLDVSVDIDNVFVLYKPINCENLLADISGDCRVSMDDFVLLAQQWLINCNNLTDDPFCQ